MASSKDKWIRRFFIAETGRHKDGFTIYKVTSLIFLKNSPGNASKISVWKRYNDFRKLYKSLDALKKYSSIKEPFPPFAKPNYFGRFEKEVVNERRECAIKLLDFIAKHYLLYTSDAFIKFFETSLNLEDGPHDCIQSITSCDVSSDDDCVNSSNITSKNNEKSMKYQSTDLSFKNYGIHNIIPEQNHIDTKSHRNTSSKCIKTNNTMSNINIECQEYENNIDKHNERDEKQINDSITSNSILSHETDVSDYIIVAAGHMKAGYQHELLGEYEEAYIQYEFAISHLQLGIKIDPDPTQQSRVQKKIDKYIRQVKKFYKKYLHCNSSILSKPTIELENYKVVDVIGSVMIVKDIRFFDVKRVIKTIEKCAHGPDVFHYIFHQRIPFMVHLHAYIETESSIFLIIEYAGGGSLWKYIKTLYGLEDIKLENSSHNCLSSTSWNNLFIDDFFKLESDKSPLSVMKNDYNFDINFTKTSRTLNDKSDSDLNISTNQLMEQSQELLKSVNEILQKSNSMTGKDENSIFKSNDVNHTLKINNTQNLENNELSLHPSCTLNHSTSKNIDSPNSSNTYHLSNITQKFKDDIDINESEIKKTTILDDSSILESDNNESQMDQKNWQIPEAISKQWAAQIILALEALHKQNVIITNLQPEDLLIDQNDHIALSYVIPRQINEITNLQIPYAAPELFLNSPHFSINSSVDIWSFGVILYELLTGISFQKRHSGLFSSHFNISIPHDLTESAKSLLKNVLKFEPGERFTLHQIKNDTFFENIDWKKLASSQK